MLITINKKNYKCLRFIQGEYHNLKIEVEGYMNSIEHNIDIKYKDFEGFGYKILPHYKSESNSTTFLVYIYQPGDPELRIL